MIYWVTTRRHGYTIRRHLASFGRPLVSAVTPLSYGRLLRQRDPARGVYVLTDVERLSRATLQRATALCDRLRGSGSIVLNRPVDCLGRHDLLRGLHRHGVNVFDVHRVSDIAPSPRFPVFLRLENDHKGPRSPLLNDEVELRAAIDEQCRTRFWFRDEHAKRRLLRIGGHRRRALLVTEFCDTVDSQGMYRKYAAFCVGGQIIARHLFFAKRWMLKWPEQLAVQQLAEEVDYVRTNPHAEQLAELFRFARIEFGRIDYSLLEGRIQVWEINTNPMICAPADELCVERLPVQRLFAERFEAALRQLDDSTAGQVRRAA